MKNLLPTWLFLLLVLLAACTPDAVPTPRPTDDDDDGPAPNRPSGAADFSDADLVESWEFLPFYGELRFALLDADTKMPIPTGLLEVDNLVGTEAEPLLADENGRIIFHQLERGIMYMGDGPPPPQFTFSAPGYTPHSFNAAELAALAGYDPYNSTGVPLTQWIDPAGSPQELPLYEFKITLTCAQASCVPE